MHCSTWLARSLSTLMLAGAASAGVGAVAPASAADAGSIDFVETSDRELRVLFSLPELSSEIEPDLGTLRVAFEGTEIDATAAFAAQANETDSVRRTTILAVDVSRSMRGDRFTAAKAAALAFLNGVSDDIYVGLVTFAGDVELVQPPTLDRAPVAESLSGLELSLETRLNDGVLRAVSAAGEAGQRRLLVLSDGQDTSDTPLGAVTQTVQQSGVNVDVVALEQSGSALDALTTLAEAGEGGVVNANNPDALTDLFTDEATQLARQLLVTGTIPSDLSGREGTLTVSIAAGDETYTDTAFSGITAFATEDAQHVPGAQPAPPPRLHISQYMFLGGLAAAGAGFLVVLITAFGATGSKRESIEDRVGMYTHAGARRAQASQSAPVKAGVHQSAVGLAQKALSNRSDLEATLGNKLDAAGMSLKPAEWLLLHVGIAFGVALFGFLITSGNILLTLALLFAGAFVPWFYLSRRKDKRLKAFNSQLAETLQLISGSLSAGLSLAQSLDTVVREGADPIASEFRRALIEARLGVQIEDSLDSIAQRMDSPDFAWVVMAIRIQREVGGNLAELLLNVAGTLRERDYLRRQVKTLSAEGRMSAWILCGLPPALLLYMSVVNPSYLAPMIASPLGWALIGLMIFLLAVGAFWMSRVVKVEV